RADVIAGGEEMAGIQTNPEALRAAHLVINLGQVLEVIAEATPLPGSVLQSHANRRLLCRLKDFIKTGDDLLKPGLFTLAQVRTGMHDQKGEAKVCRELNLLNERLQRFVAVVAIRRAEIDEITDMAEDGGNFHRCKFFGV